MALRTDLATLSQLPILPTVAVEILRCISQSEFQIDDLMRLIQSDPALTGKVLAAANSARYNTGRPITDLNRASMSLGKRVTGSLALSLSLSSALTRKGPDSQRLADYWRKSLALALAAKTLAERFGGCQISEAFTVGLMCRVGELALIKHAFSDYDACVRELEQRMTPREVVEERRLGVTSHALSQKIFAHWKLPEAFGRALDFDQDVLPESHGDLIAKSPTPLQMFLHVGGRAAEFYQSTRHGLALIQLHEAFRLLSDNLEDDVEWLVQSVSQQLEANAPLFAVEVPGGADAAAALFSEATQQLTRLILEPADAPVPAGDEELRRLVCENTALQRRIEELNQESTTDPLTGLHNRRSLHRQLQMQIGQAQREERWLGLLLADIDHFKSVNDRHGHLVGDQVLRAVAEKLQRSVRTGDLVARFGGEEFALLTQAQSLPQLMGMAERLRQSIQEIRIPLTEGELSVTISFGAVLARPLADGNACESRLLGEADRCLYEAKTAGRNRVVARQLDSAGGEPRPFLTRPALVRSTDCPR